MNLKIKQIIKEIKNMLLQQNKIENTHKYKLQFKNDDLWLVYAPTLEREGIDFLFTMEDRTVLWFKDQSEFEYAIKLKKDCGL